MLFSLQASLKLYNYIKEEVIVWCSIVSKFLESSILTRQSRSPTENFHLVRDWLKYTTKFCYLYSIVLLVTVTFFLWETILISYLCQGHKVSSLYTCI